MELTGIIDLDVFFVAMSHIGRISKARYTLGAALASEQVIATYHAGLKRLKQGFQIWETSCQDAQIYRDRRE